MLITPVDFGDEEGTRRKINSWVEEKTQNRIKDLISPGVLDSMTRLVLVNAIYFKGEWAARFDPALTSQEPFLVAPGSQVQVPMMKLKHEFNYAESDGLQVLELPYAGDDLAMILLLPREVSGLAGTRGLIGGGKSGQVDKKSRESRGGCIPAEIRAGLPIQAG